MDAAVVEFDALADAVGTGPQDDHPRAVRGPHLVLVLDGRVVVRGVGLELGTTGVDGLEGHLHPVSGAGRPDVGGGDRWAEQIGQLLVGKSEPLDPTPGPAVEIVDGHPQRDLQVEPHAGVTDLGHLGEEPWIDAGGGGQLVHRDAPAEQGLELEDAFRRGRGHPHQQISGGDGLVELLGRIGVEAGPPLFERAHRLLQRLGEGPADPHDLTHRLHPGPEAVGGARQLLEGPARDLGHHVVDGRLEGGRGGSGDVIDHFVQPVAHGQSGGDFGDREPGGLGGQGRGPGYPRVHLDDHLASVGGVHGELDVRATCLHADPADAGEGGVPHGLELDIGQRLGRGHGDRVPGMDPHGIEVLDGADDHAVVGPVPHHLELELLVPGDGLLDQHLVDRRGVEALGGQPDQMVSGGGDPGSGSPQDVAGTDHDRVADGVADGQGLVQRMGEARVGNGQADLLHGLLEPLAVFGGGDGFGVGSDDLDAVGLEDPPLGQGHGQVEGGLPAERREQGVRTLLLDDRGQDVRVEGLHIGPVGHGRVGHDGGRVGVDQHHPEGLLGQNPAGLGARVVELAGLTDDDGSRPDDQDRLDVGAATHQDPPRAPVASIRFRNSSNSVRAS